MTFYKIFVIILIIIKIGGKEIPFKEIYPENENDLLPGKELHNVRISMLILFPKNELPDKLEIKNPTKDVKVARIERRTIIFSTAIVDNKGNICPTNSAHRMIRDETGKPLKWPASLVESHTVKIRKIKKKKNIKKKPKKI